MRCRVLAPTQCIRKSLKRRLAEIVGLKEALSILQGSAALLQEKNKKWKRDRSSANTLTIHPFKKLAGDKKCMEEVEAEFCLLNALVSWRNWSLI